MKIPTGLSLAALVLLSSALTAAGQTVSEYRHETPEDYRHSNQPWDQIPGSFLTPHVAWANPGANAALKVLVITPCWASRDVVELGERLQLEPSVLMICSPTQWYGKEPYYNNASNEQLRRATEARLSAASRYQAIVLAGVSWEAIPEEYRQRLLTHVRAGTGLLYAKPPAVPTELAAACQEKPDAAPAAELSASLPLPALPLDVELDVSPGSPYAGFTPRHVGPLEIQAGALGAGRVALLDWHDQVKAGFPWGYRTGGTQSLTPDVEYDALFYEYYHALLAKLLRWAAKQDPAVVVRPAAAQVPVERAALPGKPVGFTAQGAAGDARRYSLYWELRDRGNAVVAHGEAPLALAGDKAVFAPPLPRVPGGLYMVDLWVKRGGRTVDWGSAALTVRDTLCLGKITPDAEFFPRGKEITGALSWQADLPAGRQAVLELWDTWDRLEQRLSLAAGAKRFSFKPVASPLSRAYRLAWKVLEKGTPVEETACWVGVPDRTLDDFAYLAWSEALRTRYSLAKLERLKRLGVTGYYDTTATWNPEPTTRQAADLLAQNNLTATPYCYGVWGFCIAEQVDWPKFGYGKYADTLKNFLTDIYPPRVRAYRRYGTLAYSVCEESYINRGEEQWTNPEAVRDLRRFLPEQYGEVAQLNGLWGTAFKSFDEIGVISLAEAKQTGQYARWYDQERHKTQRFMGVQEAVHQKIQELDPGAWLSTDCSGSLDYDWPRIMKIIRGGTAYPGQELRKGTDDLLGDWTGAYERQLEEGQIRSKPWRTLLEGGRQLAWWPSDTSSGLGGSSALTPDLSEPLLAMRQTWEEVREIRQGVGKLLLSSQLQMDPVLILWSTRSYYAGILNPADISWTASRTGWLNLLRSAGFSPRVVDSEYLEKSLKYDAENRVLVLPCAQALSRLEVQRVREFMQQGGLVVADVIPAVFDEHLRPCGGQKGDVKEALCEKCKGKGRLDEGTTIVTCPVCGGTGKVVIGGLTGLTSQLADAFDFTQKGVRAVGKGFGMYLQGFPANKQEWSGLRRTLLDRGGVPGLAEVTDAVGTLRVDVKCSLFQGGSALFVGLMPDVSIPDPPGPETVLRLAAKYHAYDVRRHQYLGYGDRFELGVLPAQASILALLPARMEGLALSVDKPVCAPGDTVTLRGQLAPATLKDSQAVAHVEVLREGRPLACYTRNVAFRGALAYPLPLALNVAPGAYLVRATEVVTGVTEETTFTVK